MTDIKLTWNNRTTDAVSQKIYRSLEEFDSNNLPAVHAEIDFWIKEYLDEDVIEDAYWYMLSTVTEDDELFSDCVRIEKGVAGECDPHWDKVVGLYRPVDGVIKDISMLSNPMLYNTGLIIDALEHFNGLPVMRLNANNRAAFSMPPLGKDDFTIEMFHRANATHSSWPRVWSTLDQNILSNAAVTMQISSASDGHAPNALHVWVGSGSRRLITPAGSGATGVLTHVALCRRGEQLYLAYNGQIVDQLELPVFNDTNPTFVFGQGNASRVAQWFTEVRITKGVARYIENFTPPTKPFPNC